MLRKMILITLLALPSCCWAWANGFYAGAGIGIDAEDFNQTTYTQKPATEQPPFDAFMVKDKTEPAAQGVFGTVFGGYGWHCGLFYLAGELNADASSAKFHSSNVEAVHGSASRTTYKINQSWGASVLPGIVIPGDALLYGRIGYAGGNFHINTSDDSLPNADKMLNGVRYGLGLEKRIFRNFDLRFDYSHINYSNFSRFVVVPDNSGVTKRTIESPESNLFELGFVFRFC